MSVTMKYLQTFMMIILYNAYSFAAASTINEHEIKALNDTYYSLNGKHWIKKWNMTEINEGINKIVPIAYLRNAACGAGTSPSKYLTVAVTPTNKIVVITIQKIPTKD